MFRRVQFAKHATGIPLAYGANSQCHRNAGEHHAARFESMNQQVNSSAFSERRTTYDEFMRGTPTVHTSQRLDEMHYKPQGHNRTENSYKTWVDFPIDDDKQSSQQQQPQQGRLHPHMVNAGKLKSMAKAALAANINKTEDAPKENKGFGGYAEAQDHGEFSAPRHCHPFVSTRLDEVHYKSKFSDKKPTLVEYVIGLRGKGGLAKDRVRAQNHHDKTTYSNSNQASQENVQTINQAKTKESTADMPKLDARRLVQRRLKPSQASR